MQKFLLIVLLAAAPLHITAQSHSNVTDSIDSILRQCQDSVTSTYATISCLDDALDAWDKELNRVYKDVMQHLDEKNKELLKSAQRKWLEFRDQEFAFSNQFYDRQGKGWAYDRIYRQMELTRTRVFELRKYRLAIYDADE